ncbi:MAG: hypothetical protein NTV94_02825 [Planctomycetota bacterium]|nr:hypothetical protein [Planctomycetota bacterium]
MPGKAPVEISGLEAQAASVVARLQRSFAAIIAAATGPIERAVDLERAMGLDKKLAWQIYRIAAASSPITEVRNIPASSSIRRLKECARRKKLDKAIIDELSTAYEEFEAFASVHAGTREGLISMLSGISEQKNDAFEVKVRKGLFKGNAHVWGVQADLLIRTGIFYRRPGPNHIEDAALIHGEVGIQRLRRFKGPGILARMQTRSDPVQPGVPSPVPRAHPLELLSEFCSGQLPAMHERDQERSETELVIPAGRTGAQTIYAAQWYEHTTNAPQSSFEGRTFITLPVERAVWEVLIPVGQSDPSTARVAMLLEREHPERSTQQNFEECEPLDGEVTYLGQHRAPPALDGSPRHHEAVSEVLRRRGWSEQLFDIYRCTVEYPILHSMVVLRVDAPK